MDTWAKSTTVVLFAEMLTKGVDGGRKEVIWKMKIVETSRNIAIVCNCHTCARKTAEFDYERCRLHNKKVKPHWLCEAWRPRDGEVSREILSTASRQV